MEAEDTQRIHWTECVGGGCSLVKMEESLE